jgi:hydrogenase maturation protease
MNLACVDQIAKAVLYEGYMLYPYRPSSVKNRQRWNFGVVYPQVYSNLEEGQPPASMRTECLVSGSPAASVEVRLRFLQLQARSAAEPSATSGALPDGWQEAVEREVRLTPYTLGELCRDPVTHRFLFPAETRIEPEQKLGRIVRRQEAVEGTVNVEAESLAGDLFRIKVLISNTTPMKIPASGRDAALMHSLVSSHTILGVERGEFISLLEPPDGMQELAAQCQNVGAWPVLVGEEGQRDTVLASPIILYDYPQIAPESVGDLFDGTEIDEILSLRIMTLTDDEKNEMRQSDDRARQILERTENMPTEQFMKLHGAVRGMRPLKEDAS